MESAAPNRATQFARSPDGRHIAFQVAGDTGTPLLYTSSGFISIDSIDDEPDLARAMGGLESFCRVMRFDRGGIGLSDPVSEAPTLEQWIGDALAVLDAVSCQSTAVFAPADVALMAIGLAAMHPERVTALVLIDGYARFTAAPDYPYGWTPEEAQDIRQSALAGDIDVLSMIAPTRADDERFRAWWDRAGHRGASPATAAAIRQVIEGCDVRPLLASVRAPVLVVYRTESSHSDPGHGRYLVEHLPNARAVELGGSDLFWWVADTDRLLADVEEFLTGSRSAPNFDRVLTTVLFTDIVSSTARAASLGDRRWQELLGAHNALVRGELERFGGREVDTAGDGFLATFDGPARAIRCACAIRDAVRTLGIEIRAGIHTGEVEVVGDDLAGINVHIGARVSAAADPGEVLVSRTVKDLVGGSELRFADRGPHTLKGVPQQWSLFAVAN